MNQISIWLRPPIFADEEKTRRAQTLHVLQIYMSLAFFVGGLLGVLFIFPEKVITTLTLLAGVVVLLTTFALNRRGQVERAAAVLFTALWLITTALVILSQGMRSLDLLFYISGTVGVGLALGLGGMSFYVGATVIATLVIALLAQLQVVTFPNFFPFPPLSGWVLLVMNLIFTVIPLNMTLRNLSRALAAAQAELHERRLVESNLQSRERILEAITFAAEQFLKSSDWRQDIDVALARLGQSIDASHAYIFENHLGPEGNDVTSLRFEWAAPGQRSDLADPLYQNSPLVSEGYERFFEVLQRGQILPSDKTTMTQEEADFVYERGILALLDVPIMVNGRFWGIMGFDDCVQDRVWQPVEMDALKTAANIVSAVIERQQTDEALRQSEERYRLISSLSSDYTFSTRLGEAEALETDWIAGAFERITGYSIAEFLARGGWEAVVHPEDRAQDAADRAQLRQNQPVISEVRILHRDGSVRWVRSYAHPVWDEAGQRLKGIVGGVQDITERKGVEESLRASEEKFAKAFQASPDAITISTLTPDSQFVEVNEGFVRISGFKREEVLQRPIRELNIWPDAEERGRVVKRLLTNGRVINEEIILYTKAGELHNFLLSADTVEIGGEAFAVFIARDITERKRMEEALRLSEQKFAKAFQATPDAIAILTVQDEGRILEVNDSFVRESGFSREEALHQTLRELGLWGDRESQQRVMQILRENGRVVNEEVVLRQKDGRRQNVLISAEMIEVDSEPCVVVIARNITAHRHIESMLERERLLLRTMIDTLPDYIYLKDREHRCVLTNIANAQALGANSVEEVEGKTLFDFYPPAEAEHYNAKDRDIIMTGEAVLNEENSFVDLATGQVHWTWMSRIPFRMPDGRIEGVVGMSRDITAYKEALMEQERLITELQTKNAELERFTYTVSHDLKSPLVTITGFLGFLEKDAVSGNVERLRSDIGKIRDAADKMKELLNDLLELSRVGRLINAPTLIPFADIVKAALDIVSGQIDARGVQVTVATDLPVVQVDKARLVEVVQNLLDNAVRFMGDQPAPHIRIGARYDDRASQAIFFVADNGIGIAPQYHENIFGLFNRLNPSAEGTGIGLALVKRIVEVHGGQVWVESAPGQGATFCFTLPVEAAV